MFLFGIILTCAVLLSYVIGLSLWQGIVVTLFCASIWLTGRGINHERREDFMV